MRIEYKIKEQMFAFESIWWQNTPVVQMAEDAAKDYYNNHDGWEDSWPIEVEIYLDGESERVFTVDLDFGPTFTATPK